MIKILLSAERAANPQFKLVVVDEQTSGKVIEIGKFDTLQIMYEPTIKRLRHNKLNELAAELALAKAAYDELKTNGHYRWHSESATFEPITASVLGQYATGRAAVECPAPSQNILERRSAD